MLNTTRLHRISIFLVSRQVEPPHHSTVCPVPVSQRSATVVATAHTRIVLCCPTEWNLLKYPFPSVKMLHCFEMKIEGKVLGFFLKKSLLELHEK